jgi:hypothetical protein
MHLVEIGDFETPNPGYNLEVLSYVPFVSRQQGSSRKLTSRYIRVPRNVDGPLELRL